MRPIAALILLALASGCAKKPEATGAANVGTGVPVPAGVPAVATSTSPASLTANVVPAAPAPPLATVSGTVLETIDASDYTYMRLKTDAGEMWAAVTRAKIKKGEKVTVVNAMSMDGFESKTLKRKFDRLVFGSLGQPGGAPDHAAADPAAMVSDHQAASAGMGAAAPPTKEQLAAQHGQAAGGPEDATDVKVPRAEGANAKTVAELWSQRVALKGKEVSVKGKVVKVTARVMGKNWLHVRDGSGSKAAKDNDLAVTTEGVANVGDVVTVNGVVSVDKDFGAGYAYPVIIENARLK